MTGKETGHRVRVRRWLRLAGAAAVLSLLGGLHAQARTTAPLTPAAFHPLPRADRILVLKRARKLELIENGRVVKVFPIALGENPIGAKRLQGDGKTPEGVYTVDARQSQSRYHLALHISYPNADDRAAAAAAHHAPGGDIEIHGLPNWYMGPLDPVRFDKDWTDGCISVGDRAIEQIWAAVAVGTPIEIRP
ncbi:MAG TPA: L,D-transpeptidase family protein [Stellaceae bacterium]|jgi:murein L,D-transpeptidase YafK